MNDSRVETVYAVEERKYIPVSYGSSGWEEEVNPDVSFGVVSSREDARVVVSQLQVEVVVAYRTYCLETEERNSRLLNEYIEKVSSYLSSVNTDDPITSIRNAPYPPNTINFPQSFYRWVREGGRSQYAVVEIPLRMNE